LNYLAHLHLSGTDSGIITGNFIADAVKGKNFMNYPEQVSQGILLHRFIDTYTDEHQIVRQGKERLRKTNGKYAGVVMDVFYDHFLAVHWSKFSEIPLEQFSSQMQQVLTANSWLFPEKSSRFFYYMIRENILVNYRETKTIEKVLAGMAARTPFTSNMENAVNELRQHYEIFEEEFFSFFPQIVSDTKNFLVR
jgi:acyl carrier protein phosphodiesterase